MPDLEKIAQWEKERSEFDDIEDALPFDDEAKLRAIVTQYSAQVQAEGAEAKVSE